MQRQLKKIRTKGLKRVNNTAWIIAAAAGLELLIIAVLLLRTQKKGRDEATSLCIRIINGDEVDAKEADALLKKSDDFVIPYILKAMIYRRQGKPERSFNTLISLLVKSSLKKELKRTINFMAAEDLLELGRYDEAMKYADKADNLFFRKTHVNLLRARIRLFSKGDIEQDLIKSMSSEMLIRLIKKAYAKENNSNLLKNAVAYGVFDSEICEKFILKCNKNMTKDFEMIFSSDYKNARFNRTLLESIFRYIGAYESPDKIMKKLRSSTMPACIRDMVILYAMHAAGAEETDIKIHIEGIRRNVEKIEYPELMIYTLLRTGNERFIPLFREAQ